MSNELFEGIKEIPTEDLLACTESEIEFFSDWNQVPVEIHWQVPFELAETKDGDQTAILTYPELKNGVWVVETSAESDVPCADLKPLPKLITVHFTQEQAEWLLQRIEPTGPILLPQIVQDICNQLKEKLEK